MKMKKIAATFAALAMAVCSMTIPTSAASNGVSIEIDCVEITRAELAAMDYKVPVYVNLVECAGVNAVEFGITIDSRCDFTIYTAPRPAYQIGGKILDWNMTTETNGTLTWLTWASSTLYDYPDSAIVMFHVTVPENASVGTKYDISYVEQSSKLHIWNDNINNNNYVANDTVEWQDGYIKIVG